MVNKPLADYPAILKRQTTLSSLLNIIRLSDPGRITTNYYQDSYRDQDDKNQMRVRDKLNSFYHHKCAYCESLCKAEIEHYRPKAAITGPGAGVGYYWLCYEWSNLIPSCHECNASGGKANQFPIKGIKAIAPQLDVNGALPSHDFRAAEHPLIDEEPYLLHPEIDNPELFLGVHIDSAREGLKLFGLDGTDERGDETIRICNLNRTDLNLRRLKTLNFFIKGVNAVFAYAIANRLDDKALLEAIDLQFKQMDDDKVDEKSEHTLVSRYAMRNGRNFADLVLPLFETSQRQIILAAFEKYLLQRGN
ncbi:hypothetical protein [Dyadobacter sp.]|uniref:hypothetical protein n=1 Tax=Dyadobacter sp. TaxID=1914288 RepID=UPI003F6F95CB